jgi:thiol-disulfide isomerase/thioredoxin
MALYEEEQTLTVLDVDGASGTPASLASLRAGKPLVLDFWHTRCTNCPAAITKLDVEATKHKGVTFAACALSLGSQTEGTQSQVLELLEDQWHNLTHLYMTFDEKERAKAEFGFKAVPFCVVFAADGAVLYTGDPMKVDFSTVFSTRPPALAEIVAVAQATVVNAPTTTELPASVAPSQGEMQPLLQSTPAKAPAAEPSKTMSCSTSPTSIISDVTIPDCEAVVLGFGNDDEDF